MRFLAKSTAIYPIKLPLGGTDLGAGEGSNIRLENVYPSKMAVQKHQVYTLRVLRRGEIEALSLTAIELIADELGA